jgi:hypothetical protein
MQEKYQIDTIYVIKIIIDVRSKIRNNSYRQLCDYCLYYNSKHTEINVKKM